MLARAAAGPVPPPGRAGAATHSSEWEDGGMSDTSTTDRAASTAGGVTHEVEILSLIHI